MEKPFQASRVKSLRLGIDIEYRLDRYRLDIESNPKDDVLHQVHYYAEMRMSSVYMKHIMEKELNIPSL
ncbi:unnamed protein product [Arctia plantaginis]|uniref:Uncharacterized protein n=1 Tax=Arctia plantaginis TaxID=874455 RepID=A0A8S1ANS6_ARCPL|nr:unnamed protein product [Arctia plantaginis]